MAVDMNRPKSQAPKAASNVERVTITPSANGGYVVECHKKPPKAKKGRGGGIDIGMYVPPVSYTYSNMAQLVKFIREEL